MKIKPRNENKKAKIYRLLAAEYEMKKEINRVQGLGKFQENRLSFH